MQATFFATETDLLQVIRWFLDVPGMRLLEPYSRPDLPNRWFSTEAEVAQLFGEPVWSLGAWMEPARGRPRPEVIEFTPDARGRLGAKGRTVLASPALIGIWRDNDQQGCLGASNLLCWNENGARQRSNHSEEFLDEVDWKVLLSTVGSLQRKLRKSAPAKLGSCPIMGDAFEKLRTGDLKLWNWGSACTYPSPHITVA